MDGELYDGIRHVVKVSTESGTACEHCDEFVGLDRFAESVNHYMDSHGYRLLYVGGQTCIGGDGEPTHEVVAVLGQ